MKKLLAVAAACALGLGVLAVPAHAAPFGPSPTFLKSEDVDGPLAAIGSRVVFRGHSAANGTELWISDGTSAGTKLVKDLEPGTDGSELENLTSFQGKAWFSANPGGDDELWVTDGTAAGTKLFKDLAAGASSSPEDFAVAGGKLYFTATTAATGRELWVSDGTVAGTVLVEDIDGAATSSGISTIYPVGTKVAFAADGGTGDEPWISNGTPSGTAALGNIEAGDSNPTQFTGVENRILFRATNDGDTELYRSSGISSGAPVRVKDINPGAASSSPGNFFAYDGGHLMRATRDGEGSELWATDGTAGGTQLVRELRPGASGSAPNEFTLLGNTVYFSAGTTTGTGLWKTQGTYASTRLVKDINPGGDADVEELTLAGGLLYFIAENVAAGEELWVSDGTEAGTRLVKDLKPGAGTGVQEIYGPLLGTVFFDGDDGAAAEGLYSYTGRTSTTKGYPKSKYSKWTDKKKRIYVTVKVRATGTTPTGTVILKKGSAVIGSRTLSGGNASVRITKKLGKGTHTIRAYYVGSLRAQASISGTFKVRVK